jgi:hypothetical protein
MGENTPIGAAGKLLNLHMKLIACIFICTALCMGCSPAISMFDQYAYIQTTSIKVDALDLMQLATTDYTLHEKEVYDLSKEIRKIYEYDKNMPKNEKTVQQWDLLMDPNGILLGRFLKRWQDDRKLNSAYIADKVPEIGAGFDQIIYLEIGKNKSTN